MRTSNSFLFSVVFFVTLSALSCRSGNNEDETNYTDSTGINAVSPNTDQPRAADPGLQVSPSADSSSTTGPDNASPKTSNIDTTPSTRQNR
jgi:hypothetical protein